MRIVSIYHVCTYSLYLCDRSPGLVGFGARTVVTKSSHLPNLSIPSPTKQSEAPFFFEHHGEGLSHFWTFLFQIFCLFLKCYADNTNNVHNLRCPLLMNALNSEAPFSFPIHRNPSPRSKRKKAIDDHSLEQVQPQRPSDK